MKKIMFFIILIDMVFVLYAQNVESIVRNSCNRINAETISTRSRGVYQTESGTVSEWVFDQYSKDGPNGKRLIIVFQSPNFVKGNRILTLEKPGSEDDCWINISFLGRVVRMNPEYSRTIFMDRPVDSNLSGFIERGFPGGNDFSYDDIVFANRNVSLDSHTLLREETVGGTAYYVIQSIPKNNAYLYSKMILWIAKDTLITMKIELYDKDNTLVKIGEMSDLKEVQGHLITTVTKMSTLATRSSTTIFTDIIKYNDNIPEGVFTIKYLETGRP
jgi:hypothetical protein